MWVYAGILLASFAMALATCCKLLGFSVRPVLAWGADGQVSFAW
jgi:hypothetical protein